MTDTPKAKKAEANAAHAVRWGGVPQGVRKYYQEQHVLKARMRNDVTAVVYLRGEAGWRAVWRYGTGGWHFEKMEG